MPIPTCVLSLTVKAGVPSPLTIFIATEESSLPAPCTINRAPGEVVPIPTRPFSLILKAGSIGLAPSCKIFKVGAPA